MAFCYVSYALLILIVPRDKTACNNLKFPDKSTSSICITQTRVNASACDRTLNQYVRVLKGKLPQSQNETFRLPQVFFSSF